MPDTPEWTKELFGTAPGSKGENGSRGWRSNLPITPTCMGAINLVPRYFLKLQDFGC